MTHTAERRPRTGEAASQGHVQATDSKDTRSLGQADAVAAMSVLDRGRVDEARPTLPQPFSVDDLRDICEPLTLSGSPACWGGLIAGWAKSGLIHCVGVTESRRRPGYFVREWVNA